MLLAAALLCAPALAEDAPETRLKAVQHAIEQGQAAADAASKAAAALTAEITALRDKSVAAAAAEQAQEATLAAIESQRVALAAESRAKSAVLARDGARQKTLLMALVRVADTPPESVVFAPQPPLQSFRAALLMAKVVPDIEARSAALNSDIQSMDALQSSIAQNEQRYERERQDLSDQQARIQQLMSRKAALQQAATRSADEGRRHLVVLAAEAGSLRELIERIEAEHRKEEAERRKEEAERAISPAEPQTHDATIVVAPPPVRPDPSAPSHPRQFADAKGAVVYPVTGTLVGHFGAAEASGAQSRGLTFETRPGAQVVAPFDGQVQFAGPFRGYGQILIIAHGDGYHSLLAGLDRLESSVGQWLVAGEPVGTMADGADNPRLYLELRHNNQPINPAPWFTTRVEKVSE
ncbi:MAG TPA: peptidoglycan DD-metalloendopeptidase family protein [Stellaceae bacterium]|nr:peptidoglycan DD-metalloendopeptidase family protein [Stellaceae bacterium]